MLPLKKAVVPVIFGLMASGCSNFQPLHKQVEDGLQNHVQRVQEKNPLTEPQIVHKEAAYFQPGREIEVSNEESISMDATQASYYGLLQSLTKKIGFTLTSVEGVGITKKINVEINGQTPEQAIRQIAFLAGYVAVFNTSNKTVILAEKANHTYRLPPNLLRTLSAKYTVGGNPVGSSGGGGGGSSTGSSGLGEVAPIRAEFTITGEAQSRSAAFASYLQQIAGGNSTVSIYPDTGLIDVRGNAQSLKRMSDWMTHFVADALRQVEVSASIIEVQIGDDFKYGIEWNKVLNAAGTKSFNLSVSPFSASAPSAATLNITTASITAIISALDKFTKISVVSQPKVLTLNHTPATLFDGRQIPYLPSFTQSTTGTSPTTTQTATGAYALDGVSISVIPDILNNNLVQMTLIPVTSNVGDFKTFLNGTLQMPEQITKQSMMQVLVESGQTVILGGNRSSNHSDATTGLPGVVRIPILGQALSGVANIENIRENVVLVRATILPAPPYNPLVAEAL